MSHVTDVIKPRGGEVLDASSDKCCFQGRFHPQVSLTLTLTLAAHSAQACTCCASN